jgi:hypothetical protein
LPTASFEHRGKHISRERFDGPTGIPTYAWIIDGVPAAYIAAQLARRAILEVNVAPTVDDDGYLYHFTSAEGLAGILRSRELWLTDYRDFIDKSEIRHGLAVAKATFSQTPALDDATRELLYKLVETPSQAEVYVGCFCMLAESPHHWQEYAKDSTGGALMLDPLQLQPFIESDPFAIQFTRVAYSWDSKERLFSEMARRLDALVRFDLSRDLFDRDSYMREMTQLFAELVSMCKDVSYLSEHELRIVVTPARSRVGLAKRLTARSFNGRRYITTRDVLNDFDLPIEEVIVGDNFSGDPASLLWIPKEAAGRDLRRR